MGVFKKIIHTKTLIINSTENENFLKERKRKHSYEGVNSLKLK